MDDLALVGLADLAASSVIVADLAELQPRAGPRAADRQAPPDLEAVPHHCCCGIVHDSRVSRYDDVSGTTFLSRALEPQPVVGQRGWVGLGLSIS